MRRHLGKLILIGIAIAGGYLIFSKENTSAYVIPYISVIKKEAVDLSGNVIQKTGNFAKNILAVKASDALEAASVEVENLISEAAVSVKTQTLNLLKGSIDKKVESLAVDLGVDLGVSEPVQTTTLLSPIVFAIKSGTPAYFTIKNRETETVAYEINWKDGKIDKGQIGKGKLEVVSHSWSAAGEYSIKFRITSEKGARDYEILISII